MAGSPNEEKPHPFVLDSYVPNGGVLRSVGTGDKWQTVASAVKLTDPWDLIDFNFPGTKRTRQTDPQRAMRHVNWYLREYVGCQVTHDGENWAFDPGPIKGLGKGGWKGGHIYTPPIAPVPTKRTALCTPTSSGKLGRRPQGYRLMTSKELAIAVAVFGNTLPHWRSIGIGDGLGYDGRPWTDTTPMSAPGLSVQLQFQLNLGDAANEDLSLSVPSNCYTAGSTGNLNDLLVHELTHVWQYHNQAGITGRVGIWLSSLAGSYDVTEGKSWDSYDVEQQATLVERWYHDTTAAPGTERSHKLYPYIKLVLRSGGSRDALRYVSGLNLNELSRDLADLRARGLD